MGFVEFFSDQRLAALYSYWTQKRGTRPMPGRADIEPGELRQLLPHLMLIDVVDGGRDFRYRLVGTEVERHLDHAVAGHLVGETLDGDYRTYILSLHRRVCAERAPVYAENNFNENRSGFDIVASYKRAYRLMLPLSKDGESVDMVLCGHVYQPNRLQDGPDVLEVDR